MEVLLGTCGWRRVKSLLLLYLFVVSGAADKCPKPQGKGNTVLSNDALLKNEFPEGSEITFECANGYVWEDGSGTATCVSGQWTEPTLSCKKKDCGQPRPQPHMSFDMTEGTLFGAAVQVICDKGYKLSGATTKRCYVSGWSGRAKCEVVSCAHLGEVEHGRSSWDSQEKPKYGETIEYFCDEGYTLTGNSTITCTETGKYSPPPPECEGGTDILTTDDKITPTRATSTTSPPTVEGGANILATEVFTSTTHKDKIITTSATSAAPTPVQGGRDILTTEDKITTTKATSTASPPGRGKGGDVIKKDTGLTPVIASVIGTVLVVLIVVYFLYHFLKRKGSPNGTVPIY